MTVKQIAFNLSKVTTNAADYPKDWPGITNIYNKYGGRRVKRYTFIIHATPEQIDKVLTGT